jgi:hypothetical protein
MEMRQMTERAMEEAPILDLADRISAFEITGTVNRDELVVADPTWAGVVKHKQDDRETARRLARQINIAARDVETAKADQRSRITAAEVRLEAVKADTATIAAAEQHLEETRVAADQAIAEGRISSLPPSPSRSKQEDLGSW